MAAPDARAASEAAAAAVMEANYEQQQQAWNRMREARGGRRAQQRAATSSEGADSHGADGAGSGRATMPTLSTRRGLGDEGDEEEGEEEGETRKGSSLRDEVMASPSRARAHSISEGLRFTPSRRPGPLGDWSFSRTALAQRRTETVEEAASQWEEKIEALSLLSAPAAASSPGLLAGSLLGLAFGANSCSERESAFGPSASFPSFDDEGTNGDGSIRIGNPLRPLDEPFVCRLDQILNPAVEPAQTVTPLGNIVHRQPQIGPHKPITGASAGSFLPWRCVRLLAFLNQRS
jgi:hypothetical protein